MSSTQQKIGSAVRSLIGVSTVGPASFDDLVALNTARELVDELFAACVAELSAEPAAAPMWAAVGAALEAQTPDPDPHRGRGAIRKPYGAGVAKQPERARAEARVAEFWGEHAPAFRWDFLPTSFLHALYAAWMSSHHRAEPALSQAAFVRSLKAAADRGDWSYTRARPGRLMDALEPLTRRAPQWFHDGSDDAIYGLRRSGA